MTHSRAGTTGRAATLLISAMALSLSSACDPVNPVMIWNQLDKRVIVELDPGVGTPVHEGSVKAHDVTSILNGITGRGAENSCVDVDLVASDRLGREIARVMEPICHGDSYVLYPPGVFERIDDDR
ncbi:MAG: hypothetical protein ACRDI3_05770 [Actinomycetota bacterium]